MDCEHGNVYFKDDNFYCGKCNQGMGQAYYAVAKQVQSLSSAILTIAAREEISGATPEEVVAALGDRIKGLTAAVIAAQTDGKLVISVDDATTKAIAADEAASLLRQKVDLLKAEAAENTKYVLELEKSLSEYRGKILEAQVEGIREGMAKSCEIISTLPVPSGRYGEGATFRHAGEDAVRAINAAIADLPVASNNRDLFDELQNSIAEFDQHELGRLDLRSTRVPEEDEVPPAAPEPDSAQDFICFMIDHCEGEVITEEYLQRTYADYLKAGGAAASRKLKCFYVDVSIEGEADIFYLLAEEKPTIEEIISFYGLDFHPEHGDTIEVNCMGIDIFKPSGRKLENGG